MSQTIDTSRRVIPLPQKFFCDGAYYVLTSSTLGGSGAETVASKVSEGGEDAVRELLKSEICIPVSFPGDCAMDSAIVVVGDLSAQEEAEWIGKISWKLNISCGKLLVVCGGGDAETLQGAVSGEGLGDFCDYFHQIDVEPGRHLVEVYAYLPSTTGNFYWGDECDEPLLEWQKWFKSDHQGQELPSWLSKINRYDVPGELSDRLVSYIIRVAPLLSEPASLPVFDEDSGWCTFETRRPAKCPTGIERSSLIS